MYDKKTQDPLYARALEITLALQGSDEPTLPQGDWGIDHETGKTRSQGRAKHDLKKHLHDLARRGLTDVRLKDQLEECREQMRVLTPA